MSCPRRQSLDPKAGERYALKSPRSAAGGERSALISAGGFYAGCLSKPVVLVDHSDVGGKMAFRHDGDLQSSDFELFGYLSISAEMFPLLFDQFGVKAEALLVE
jgi:hypothetical protein